MSQRYITTLDVSQTDASADVYPNKVMVYKVDTPLSGLTIGNSTVELHIGEREIIGQGTFGYWIFSIKSIE